MSLLRSNKLSRLFLSVLLRPKSLHVAPKAFPRPERLHSCRHYLRPIGLAVSGSISGAKLLLEYQRGFLQKGFFANVGKKALATVPGTALWPFHAQTVDLFRADGVGEDRRSVRSDIHLSGCAAADWQMNVFPAGNDFRI
jgi:hypothetical protein